MASSSSRALALAIGSATAVTSAAAAVLAAAGPEASSDASFTRIDLTKFNFDHHLLHTALSGDDKLERYELFFDKDARKLRAMARLGHKACGHPRIIHGGAIASLLDDAFGSLFFACRIGNGFTANLSVDYRSPIPAGADIRIDTEVEKIEGRKVYLVGKVTDASSSVLYTEGRALFIVKAVPSSDKLMAAVQSATDGAAVAAVTAAPATNPLA